MQLRSTSIVFERVSLRQQIACVKGAVPALFTYVAFLPSIPFPPLSLDSNPPKQITTAWSKHKLWSLSDR